MYGNDIPDIDLASSNRVYYLSHHLGGTGHEGITEHPKIQKTEGCSTFRHCTRFIT